MPNNRKRKEEEKKEKKNERARRAQNNTTDTYEYCLTPSLMNSFSRTLRLLYSAPVGGLEGWAQRVGKGKRNEE